MNTLLGTKKKMSQTFVESTRVSVTVVEAPPCVVTQIKDMKKDGYWAVQLGFGEKHTRNVTKPLQGHLRGVVKEKIAPRFLREVRMEVKPSFKVGDSVSITDVFKVGDTVTVTGVSKGKGFAGVVKRWGFAGGPKTHGQSDRHRAPGSIGQGTDPGRVRKGKKMAGNMGNERVTVKNLRVVSIDPETNEIWLSGPIPGATGSLVFMKKTASGSLDELVEEAPEIVTQEEAEETDEPKETGEEVANE